MDRELHDPHRGRGGRAQTERPPAHDPCQTGHSELIVWHVTKFLETPSNPNPPKNRKVNDAIGFRIFITPTS